MKFLAKCEMYTNLMTENKFANTLDRLNGLNYFCEKNNIMKINPNAPANPIANSEGFPSYVETLNSAKPECIGLSIRQQFAMAAMQGILANLPKMLMDEALQMVSQQSVRFSDALIAELNRTEAE